MSMPVALSQEPLASRLGNAGAAGIAAAAAFALTLNVHVQSFHTARLGIALAVLLAVHLVTLPRIVVMREAMLYACLLGYLLIQLLWTADLELALNTIVPAGNFVLILLLFGSLASFHDPKAALLGTVLGFLAGAAVYTAVAGFPFGYPADFSYNAVATMYLFGLISILLLATCGRWQWTLLALAAVTMAMIVATTSIKTNLGILLGIAAAGVVHFGYLTRLLRRNAILVLALLVAGGIAAAANETIVGSLRQGADRVALGIDILQARDDVPGYSAYAQRGEWQREGIRGWSGNPVFGHGVEEFRREFGATSHSTAVDLLYNSGVVGFALFYGVLISMLLRLYRARRKGMRDARAVILGGVVCYLFISLSGTMHYNAFLATFVALGAALLARHEPVAPAATAAFSRA